MDTSEEDVENEIDRLSGLINLELVNRRWLLIYESEDKEHCEIVCDRPMPKGKIIALLINVMTTIYKAKL